MRITSREANKLLQRLKEDLSILCVEEEKKKTFLAAVGEDVETCRPNYDFVKMQEAKEALENKIVKIKHELNLFNIKTEVPGFNMTIDQMLVYIPQLTQRKRKFSEMLDAIPKQRDSAYIRSNVIDYRYLNYDLNDVRKKYDEVNELLSKAQIALDKTNNEKYIDIDL